MRKLFFILGISMILMKGSSFLFVSRVEVFRFCSKIIKEMEWFGFDIVLFIS